jgi:hypothetical protein
MASKKLIYEIFTDLPLGKNYGTLTIRVSAMSGFSDHISFQWQCNMHDKDRFWYGKDIQAKYNSYNLLPLVEQIKKAKIFGDADMTIEQIITFLESNNIQHALYITLFAYTQLGESRSIFHGMITEKDLLNGKFKIKKSGSQMTIKIPADQQRKWIKKVNELKNNDPNTIIAREMKERQRVFSDNTIFSYN